MLQSHRASGNANGGGGDSGVRGQLDALVSLSSSLGVLKMFCFAAVFCGMVTNEPHLYHLLKHLSNNLYYWGGGGKIIK